MITGDPDPATNLKLVGLAHARHEVCLATPSIYGKIEYRLDTVYLEISFRN
jgi:hypothetical protein